MVFRERKMLSCGIKSLLVFLFISSGNVVKSFEVYWNAPTQQCLKNYGHNFPELLKTYGIRVNNGDKFQGNRITIYYEKQLGLYPHILKNGTFINGGIPQIGNLTKHLEQATRDIQNTIVDENFNGVGVIDWEAWRPSWKFNWTPLQIYRDESKKYAMQKHPELSDKQIDALAQNQWENRAKLYMMKTLLLAKKMRPLASWGFYLFPDCYNYVGTTPSDFECSKSVKSENDKLSWLWKSSSSIHPSIYLKKSQLDHYSMKERSWKDNGKLKEAVRVATPYAKILPYVNYFMDKEVVPKKDFQRMVAQSASIGADGVIIWGSSTSVNSRKRCDDLKEYITEVLGPSIAQISSHSQKCSRQICNGHGHCTWPSDEHVTIWQLLLNNTIDFNSSHIECRCKPRFEGRFCEHLI